MGFGEALARVTQGVKQGGLPFVMAELGEQLRSDAIPPRLRPAASRLAALLRQPEEPAARAPEARPVVSLHEAASHAHDDVASAGVCPFSGARADGLMAQAFASDFGPSEPKVETVLVEDEPELPREPVVVEAQEDVIDAAPAAPVVEATVVQLEMPLPTSEAEAPSPSPSVKAASSKKEQAKRNEKLAAKPASAKQAARPNAKSAAKRTSGKAGKKK